MGVLVLCSQKLEEKTQELAELKKELESAEMSAASRFRELLQEKDRDNKLLREKVSRVESERKDLSIKVSALHCLLYVVT